MRYFDIVKFEPEKDFSSRLGFSKMYCIGRDVVLSKTPIQSEVPQIVINRNHGALIGALRNNQVVGIIFDGTELDKKIIEQAAELRKTIFLPINELINSSGSARNANLHKIRKIIFASQRMKAKVRIISLADSKEQILSAAQMSEIGKLLLKEKGEYSVFEGGTL